MWDSNKEATHLCLILQFLEFFLAALLKFFPPISPPAPVATGAGARHRHLSSSWLTAADPTGAPAEAFLWKSNDSKADPPPPLPSRRVRPHLTCQPCDYEAAGRDVLFWPRWRWEQQAQRRFIFESCVMTRKHRVCFLSLSSDTSFPASRTLVHFDGAAAGERGGLDRTSQESTECLTHKV